MKYIATPIEGLFVLEPQLFEDDRGYFMETWRQEEFDKHIGKVRFVQENESCSTFGVLRGLHYQKGDASQAKLVRVTTGCVIDVAVDLRQDSPTFGQHVMVELSEENHRMIFIPRGFAHGFKVLSERAVVTYKVDNVYAPQAECSIRYDDPTLNILWPETLTLNLSEKDLNRAVSFEEAEKF